MMISFSLPLFRKLFVFPSILKGSFAVEYSCGQVVFFHHSIKSCHSLLPCMFLLKILIIGSLTCKKLVLSCFFFLVFNFRLFNYDVSWCDFFGFLLFGILLASWIWKSVHFCRLGKFSVIISLNKLSAPFSLLLGSLMVWILVCLLVWHKFLKLFHFFSFIFPFTPWLDEFHCLLLSFPIFSFSWSTLLLNLSVEFFSWIIVSALLFFHCFKIFSVSLLKFFLCSCIAVLTLMSIFMSIFWTIKLVTNILCH